MEDSLRRLQSTQIEILQVIDSVCKKHHIKYSLYAGTLLGAVRHQGFIPWDDDLDVCMERREYDRFINAWEKEKPSGYILQNKDNSPCFTQSFTKIRKEHTTFLQAEWERGRYHTGIFVDVFPVDRVPRGLVNRLSFQWNCLCLLLFTREFIPPKGNKLQKMVSRVLLCLVRGKHREMSRKKLLKQIIKRDEDKSLQMITTETMEASRIPLPSELMKDYVFLPFEGKKYMCMSRWHDFLKAKYGDYMTLPPEAERTWKHHPIVLDFEHDLEELEHE